MKLFFFFFLQKDPNKNLATKRRGIQSQIITKQEDNLNFIIDQHEFQEEEREKR